MSVIDIHCHIWRYGLDISEAYAAWRANLLSEQGERCWREPSRTWRKEDFNVTYEDCIENKGKCVYNFQTGENFCSVYCGDTIRCPAGFICAFNIYYKEMSQCIPLNGYILCEENL